MTGMDLLRLFVEEGLSESRERRMSALKACLRDQYELDKEVRFKQVELQNKLLDLFIDVPLVVRDIDHRKFRRIYFGIMHRLLSQPTDPDDIDPVSSRVLYERDERPSIGAASFLLDPQVQEHLPTIVLEGAPGQGKSTIAQYICQIHRMRLLNEASELESIPEHHKYTPLRIPIKVDSRDLATWLSRKDPFSSDESEVPSTYWRRSLEAFLAALISHHSGGSEFTVADLHAITGLSAILLVFDGLDEVADISKRKEVVDEIVKGVNRLRENAASLQVVVTSRPAAFANSPGLPSNIFLYCQLEALTRPRIDEYAGRWLKARRLQSREGAEVRKILKEKLDQPHLRDLARNPMQLAILLSLIHNRGSSLPDKRTELYDSYVELFFSRESQKSVVVRDHRDLLVNIHQYLAWVLQSEAQQGQHSGSITNERLQKLLTEYLTHEGYDASLSQQLFTGMVERVVALVSRVEGTFEFEVQPLREYFCARYLYETAPYSPPGSPQRGNMLDRYDAIARDFYWLNVTRFYSGCFSIGELPSLADRLEELATEDGYRQTNHPRLLAATLLADWVFTQHPRSMRHVVSLILDGLGLRFLLTSTGRRSHSSTPISLPKQCGKDELVTQCFAILRGNPPRDYATDVIELMRANSTGTEIKQTWLEETLRTTGDARTRWMEYGLLLGLLAQSSVGEMDSIIADAPLDSQRLTLAYRSRQLEFCQTSEQRCEVIIQAILDRDFSAQGNRRIESVLDQFGHALDASRYASAFGTRQPLPLREIWERSERRPTLDQQIEVCPNYFVYSRCAEIVNAARGASLRTAMEWASELDPWDNIVEKSRSVWGEQWLHFFLANVASGIKSTTETCKDFPDLLDRSKSLCRRARYARLRAGTVKWWEKQFDAAADDLDLVLINLALLTWGSHRTIAELAGHIELALDRLPAREWQRLMRTVRQSVFLVREHVRENVLPFDVDALPVSLSARTAAALGLRAKGDVGRAIYLKYLTSYQGHDAVIWGFCQGMAMQLLFRDPGNWQAHLNTIERSYAEGASFEALRLPEYARRAETLALPIARTIAEHSDKFPGQLVTLAESICRRDVASRITPVGLIAQRDSWFS